MTPKFDLTIYKIGYYIDKKFIEASTPCLTEELAQKEVDELNFNTKLQGENKIFTLLPIVVRTE
jgi:hypothetical protein